MSIRFTVADDVCFVRKLLVSPLSPSVFHPVVAWKEAREMYVKVATGMVDKHLFKKSVALNKLLFDTKV